VRAGSALLRQALPARQGAAAAAVLSLALCLVPAAHAQTPCPPAPASAQTVAAGGVQAWWLPEPAPLAVGRPFALQVQLCPVDAQLLRVDATMPEHRHGMNYRPTLKPLGAGLWRVEGLLWHMSGRWQLRLDVRAQGSEHTLLQSVVLK
jgi:hypothetical protein